MLEQAHGHACPQQGWSRGPGGGNDPDAQQQVDDHGAPVSHGQERRTDARGNTVSLKILC